LIAVDNIDYSPFVMDCKYHTRNCLGAHQSRGESFYSHPVSIQTGQMIRQGVSGAIPERRLGLSGQDLSGLPARPPHELREGQLRWSSLSIKFKRLDLCKSPNVFETIKAFIGDLQLAAGVQES
jgi:hypothetical protein